MTERVKKYSKAPLPFIGQKRNFLKDFAHILDSNISNDGEGWTIVDAFGGSGLLANNAKYLKPKATVIYNDYDNYVERLQHINDTEKLRVLLLDIVDKYQYVKKQKISEQCKQEILTAIENFSGYKDYLTIGSWLAFSGKIVKTFDDLAKINLYYRIVDCELNAESYLTNIHITKQDFKKLLAEYKYKEKTLFILDPPYLCTEQRFYKQDNYFNVVDFAELINLTRPPFIFFSATKSEFISYINFIMKNKSPNYESFINAQIIRKNSVINKDVFYQDNILYKFA